MTVDIQYFGMISDRLERSTEEHTFERSNREINLRDFFESKYPILKNLSYKIAVNQELTDVVSPDSNVSEIALLPPFAGG